MGYLRHEALIVHCWDDERLTKAHNAITGIFNSAGYGSLVSGIVGAIANGGGSFFVGVDGSKEGWETSDKCSAAREEAIDYLKTAEWVDWALILVGGDDGEYRVLKSPELPSYGR